MADRTRGTVGEAIVPEKRERNEIIIKGYNSAETNVEIRVDLLAAGFDDLKPKSLRQTVYRLRKRGKLPQERPTSRRGGYLGVRGYKPGKIRELLRTWASEGAQEIKAQEIKREPRIADENVCRR